MLKPPTSYPRVWFVPSDEWSSEWGFFDDRVSPIDEALWVQARPRAIRIENPPDQLVEWLRFEREIDE